MTIKSRLNIIAALSVGTLVVLLTLLIHNNLQMTNQRDEIERVADFNKNIFELNLVLVHYVNYGEARYVDSWNRLFEQLQETRQRIADFPEQHVVSGALPSIKIAFELIQDIKTNPEAYPNDDDRQRLLHRAQSRIQSDIRMLLTVSDNLVEERRQTIRQIQADQRAQSFYILIPVVALIVFITIRIRKRIIYSLQKLLEGARNIAGGDLDRHITVEGMDEHSQLADEFNTMIDKLKDHMNREHELRTKAEENRERWENLVEQDPNMVMISIDNEVKFINTAGARMAGAEHPDDLVGGSVNELVDKPQTNEALNRVKEVQTERHAVPPTIYKINALDGKERYIQVESVPITYYGKDAVQTVGLDITKNVTYERDLQKSLEEKTTLLQEVHHRVKNNLAIISGMLYMQAAESDNERLKEQLTDSQMRIRSLAITHELLYDTESFSKLKMKDHIYKLAESIRKNVSYNNQIHVEYELEDIILGIHQALPCAMILNELAINSIKHGFPNGEAGTIRIAFWETGGTINLSIKDNGVGLPEDFDIQKAGALGMRIVNTLTRQLEATIFTRSDNGTYFYMQFRRAESQ